MTSRLIMSHDAAERMAKTILELISRRKTQTLIEGVAKEAATTVTH
jgi:hypothetical protein